MRQRRKFVGYVQQPIGPARRTFDPPDSSMPVGTAITSTCIAGTPFMVIALRELFR